jgi:hypothetical protein
VEESSCWYIVSRSGGVLVVKNSRCIVPLAYASMTTGVVNIIYSFYGAMPGRIRHGEVNGFTDVLYRYCSWKPGATKVA